MEKGKNPEFLKEKYNLQQSPEVDRSVKRKEARGGERVRNAPEERIQAYLDRIDLVLNPPSLSDDKRFDRKERNVSLMKRALHRTLIVKPEVAADEYLKHQKQQARDRGHGNQEISQDLPGRLVEVIEAIRSGVEIPPERDQFSDSYIRERAQKQMAEEIVAKIKEQESSLDYWMDYLASDDAKDYPDWFKYWVMRSVARLASFDKDEKRFPTRDERTMNPFPELDQAVLGKVLDLVVQDVAYKQQKEASELVLKRAEKKHNKERQLAIASKIAEIKSQNPDAKIDRERILEDLEIKAFETSPVESDTPKRQENDPKLQAALDAKDFAQLYALEFSKLIPTSERLLRNIEGQWVKYSQGSDHMKLVNSIERHQTGWCTAGQEVARSQLSRGDFYVYYSEDGKGKSTVPRAAIRMEGKTIAEVRGISKDQQLDPFISPVVQEKMHEFADGKSYEKRAGDMTRLTAIEKRAKLGQELTKEDLLLLYEIQGPVQGFGYRKDPRIAELREGRDLEADMLMVFECSKEQVAHNVSEIRPDTKAYVGKLEKGIFRKLPDTVELIYTAFPEHRIRKEHLDIGGEISGELQSEIGKAGMKIEEDAAEIMSNRYFKTLKNSQAIAVACLSLRDLGFSASAHPGEVYKRAAELGLEICPPETGPHYRLAHADQEMGVENYVRIGMQPIARRDGTQLVFEISHNLNGRLLETHQADIESLWHPSDKVIFRVRKKDSQGENPKPDKESVLQRLKNMIPW